MCRFSKCQAVTLREGSANEEGKRRVTQVGNIDEAIAIVGTTNGHLPPLHPCFHNTKSRYCVAATARQTGSCIDQAKAMTATLVITVMV